MIEEHPIPVTESRAAELQETAPTFEDAAYVLHPDELHERYKDVLAQNDEWQFFRSDIYGHNGYVVCWNHRQLRCPVLR